MPIYIFIIYITIQRNVLCDVDRWLKVAGEIDCVLLTDAELKGKRVCSSDSTHSRSNNPASQLEVELGLAATDLELIFLDPSWLSRVVLGPVLGTIGDASTSQRITGANVSSTATGSQSSTNYGNSLSANSPLVTNSTSNATASPGLNGNSMSNNNSNNNSNTTNSNLNNPNNNMNANEAEKRNFDGLISRSQLEQFCRSAEVNGLVTAAQLVRLLEMKRVGVWIKYGWLCIPSRLIGVKDRWLRGRGIARIPLAQHSGELKNGDPPPPVSAVIGRRIRVKSPFVFPPGLFYAIQATIIHKSERGEYPKLKISCWKRGLGLVREVDKATMNTPNANNLTTSVNGNIASPAVNSTGVATSNASVCAIIEQDALSPGVLWGDESSCYIDILAWGEGASSLSAVQSMLEEAMLLVLDTYLHCTLSDMNVLINRQNVTGNQHQNTQNISYFNPQDNISKEKKSSSSTSTKGTSGFSLEYEERVEQVSKWLSIYYLRPGCILETLALSPACRLCGEYSDPLHGNCHEPEDSPVLVSCDHQQPRLRIFHLKQGYVLSESPGKGKGMLRSISGSIERTLGNMTNTNIVRLRTFGTKNDIELIGMNVIIGGCGSDVSSVVNAINAGPEVASE